MSKVRGEGVGFTVVVSERTARETKHRITRAAKITAIDDLITITIVIVDEG